MKQNVSPHYTDRDVGEPIQRETTLVHFGVYYGKQEYTSQEDMKEEMDKLTEDILEMKASGEIILCMDGNARIGLMG